MNNVLSDIIEIKCSAYLDDIIECEKKSCDLNKYSIN